VVQQLLYAAFYIHKKGFIHGYINPNNILVTHLSYCLPNIKLINFNRSCRMKANGEAAELVAALRQPETGFEGPEQISTSNTQVALSAATDIWSIGAIAYYLLCGKVAVVNASDPYKLSMSPLKRCTKTARHFIYHCLRYQSKDRSSELSLQKHRWFYLDKKLLEEKRAVFIASDHLDSST
jgi:serine/threonine protein kinase